MKLFEVIFEDTDLLVINKPAGLVCHPTKGDEWSSLVSRTRLYLGAERTAHLINRLDRETSGVVIAAKNPSVAGQLGKIGKAALSRRNTWPSSKAQWPRMRAALICPWAGTKPARLLSSIAFAPTGPAP